MKDKYIELKLWVIITIMAGLMLIGIESFGQLNITKRTVSIDSLRSRQDTIWLTNKTGGKAWLRITNNNTLYLGDKNGEKSLGVLGSGSGGNPVLENVNEDDTTRWGSKTTIKAGGGITIDNDSIYFDGQFIGDQSMNINIDGNFTSKSNVYYSVGIDYYGKYNETGQPALFLYAQDSSGVNEKDIVLDHTGIYYAENSVDTSQFTDDHFVTKKWVEDRIGSGGSGSGGDLTVI